MQFSVSPHFHCPTPTDRTFVQLLQQSVIGLPITPLLAAHPIYQFWLEQMQSLAPQIWAASLTQKSFNQDINYPYKNTFLRANYDCLITNYQAAELHFWRNGNPAEAGQLFALEPVQLALFLVSQYFLYSPEDIQLTYWFLRDNAVIPIGVRYSRDSYSKFQVSLDDDAKSTLTQSREIHQELSLTHRFLRGEISGIDYINAIPEVEI